MYTRQMHLDEELYRDIQVHPNALDNKDAFGVEIELEGRNLRNVSQAFMLVWDQHNDGSLRVNRPDGDAVEFVFRQPYNLEATYGALKLMFEHLNRPGVEVFPSYRTSIHVHVNCAMETFRTLYNFITLSIIFDELLVSQNGDHRIGNNFCLRAKDAQGQIEELAQSINAHGNIYGLNGQHRYSSINFVSLLKFGTIEFRSLECTTDYERVKHWIDTLQRLKEASRGFEDPQDIMRCFSRMSPKEFLYSVLGGYAHKYAQVDGYEAMLQDGMRLAQDFAFSSKWLNVEKTKDAEPVKKMGNEEVEDLDRLRQFVEMDRQVAAIRAAAGRRGIDVIQPIGEPRVQGDNIRPRQAPPLNWAQWANNIGED